MAAHSSTMAAAAVLFALCVIAELQLAACYNGVVSGSVSCLDCSDAQTFNLSGIEMMVKCDKEKKVAVTTTEYEGSFEAEVPSEEAASDCVVEILGGTQKLYGQKNTTVSQIVKVGEDDSGKPYYTTATPLAVSSSCPPHRNCSDAVGGVGDSRTFEFPRDWGLAMAPASDYFKFVPIIGIP